MSPEQMGLGAHRVGIRRRILVNISNESLPIPNPIGTDML